MPLAAQGVCNVTILEALTDVSPRIFLLGKYDHFADVDLRHSENESMGFTNTSCLQHFSCYWDLERAGTHSNPAGEAVQSCRKSKADSEFRCHKVTFPAY